MRRSQTVATILAAFATMAGPAAAQQTSAELWTAFTTECGRIIADPTAAVAEAQGSGGRTGAMMTPDGSHMILTRSIDENGQRGVFSANALTVEDGRMVTCTMTMLGKPDDTAFADMPDVVAADAGRVLGAPPIALGGPVMVGALLRDPHLGIVKSWVLPGFPPPARVGVTYSEGTVVLQMSRDVPAGQ